MPVRVILDTNALMMPFQLSLNLDKLLRDLLGSWEPVLLSCVRDELEKLAEGGDRHAKAALRLAERYPEEMAEGKGDDAILKAAVRMGEGALVVTNDAGLRKRLKDAGVRTAYLRQRQYLVMG